MPKRRTTKKMGKQDPDTESSHPYSPNNQANQVPDSTVIYACRSSVRSTKKFTETRLTTKKIPGYITPENCSDDVAEMQEVSEDETSMTNHSIQMEEHNVSEEECIPSELEHLAQGSRVSSNMRAYKNKSKYILMIRHPSPFFSLNLIDMVYLCENEDDEANSVEQSPLMDTVEGYQVKPKFMLILRKIMSKHGDVFKNSVVFTMKFRSMFLEMICDIIPELQDKDLHQITEDEQHNMIGLVNEMKKKKVNIEWLTKEWKR